MCNVILSLFLVAITKMPKATQKTSSTEAEAEEVIEIEDEEGLDTEPHQALNPIEARHHIQRLNEAILNMEARIKDGEVKDVLKDTIQEIKEAIWIVMPSMKEADTLDIIRSIKDPTCLTIHPQSEEVKGLLEEIIPSDDIPSGSSVIKSMADKTTLSDEDRELIKELLEMLETAYDHIGRACGLIGALSRTQSLGQLFMILKASVRPIIQVNALPKFIEQVTQEVKPTSAPEDWTERIRSTMIPSVRSPYLKKEKPNSPSCLLAATLRFKILNSFGTGITQRRLQETYEVWAKQFALCITGHKYMGGTDRKRRSSRTEEEPSTSKRPAQ